ncbi:MAG: hypothetical protein KF764_00820 [Labilithrix sp.]|nr:hypothetical protein [Labilithrix sp.]
MTIANRIAAAPDSSILDLHASTQTSVRGAHPRTCNRRRLGGVSAITIGSMLSP